MVANIRGSFSLYLFNRDMYSFNNEHVACEINVISTDRIHIKGVLQRPGAYKHRWVIAPRPIDRMFSYHGSGLPFPCSDIAFENSPNRSPINESGEFEVDFAYPNSYYLADGRTKIPPSIFVSLAKNDTDEPILVRMELPDTDPLKTLTYRDGRDGPEFYQRLEKLGVQSQEFILRNMADAKVAWKTAR
jgi:hypothetical protein